MNPDRQAWHDAPLVKLDRAQGFSREYVYGGIAKW
jgi:hypothetical protein